MIEVKLNKKQDGLDIYDDDGLYWYTITESDMIAGLSEKESKQIISNAIDLHKPKSGDADHCYGCATMRKPCVDETRIHIETDEEYYKRVALIEGESQ